MVVRFEFFKGALDLLSHMRTCVIHLYYVAMIIGLRACSHIGVIKLGKEIHGYAIRSCCDGFHVLKFMFWVHVPTLQFVAYAILKFMVLQFGSFFCFFSMGCLKSKNCSSFAICSCCDGFHVLKFMVWVHVSTLQFIASAILKFMCLQFGSIFCFFGMGCLKSKNYSSSTIPF